MPNEGKNLSAARVPDKAYELIQAYADARGIRQSEAIRELLAASTRLRQFAHKRNLDSLFEVNTWGGNRR